MQTLQASLPRCADFLSWYDDAPSATNSPAAKSEDLVCFAPVADAAVATKSIGVLATCSCCVERIW